MATTFKLCDVIWSPRVRVRVRQFTIDVIIGSDDVIIGSDDVTQVDNIMNRTTNENSFYAWQQNGSIGVLGEAVEVAHHRS